LNGRPDRRKQAPDAHAQAAGPSVLARGGSNNVVMLLKKITRVTRILRLMRLVKLFQQYLVRARAKAIACHAPRLLAWGPAAPAMDITPCNVSREGAPACLTLALN